MGTDDAGGSRADTRLDLPSGWKVYDWDMEPDHPRTADASQSDGPQAAHARHEHDKHAGHDPEMFRRLFWWNLLLAVPVLITSPQIQDWFGYDLGGGWVEWVPPVLGTVIYVWGGKPFLLGGIVEVRNRQPGMMLLISLAITVAYGSSLAASLGWGDLEFWWELAALIVIMLLGHWQEMKRWPRSPSCSPTVRSGSRAASRWRSRSPTSTWATWCSSVPVVACPPTGSSATARPPSTSR
jgi:cation transport ATPase